MKFNIKNIIASMALFAPMALLMSCESSLEPESIANDGEGATVTVKADYPSYEFGTRTTITETETALKGSWADGDKLLITDENGKNVGTLDLKDGGGTTSATFVGRLKDDVADGEYTFTLTYLGHVADPTKVTTTSYNLDYSSQDGDKTKLNHYDLFSGKAKFKVINGASFSEERLTFKKLLSLAHFTLNFPTGVAMNGENITISGFNSTANIDLKSGELANIQAGDIVINGTNGDFYMAVIPGQNITPVFSVTLANGDQYEGTKDARDWKAPEFVCESYQVGVPVEMKADNEIKWVDLGLPSGTLWADRNLGASSPEKTGDFYCYGGTLPDQASTEWNLYDNIVYDTQQYNQTGQYAGPYRNLTALGYFSTIPTYYYQWWSIQGSTADAVSVKYDDSDYHTPNEGNLVELVNNCTFTWTTFKGINGFSVTGKNGKSMFLPATGLKNSKGGSIINNDKVILRTSLTWCNDGECVLVNLSNSYTKGEKVCADNNYTYSVYAPIRGVKENN